MDRRVAQNWSRVDGKACLEFGNEKGEGSMEDAKKRHCCLTAWLVFMIVANSAVALKYILGSEGIRQTLPNMRGWAFSVMIVMSLFNLTCGMLALWNSDLPTPVEVEDIVHSNLFLPIFALTIRRFVAALQPR